MRGIESNETDFLPPDVAFRVNARVDGNVVRVRWVIADGYYLYRQKIEVKAESPDLVVMGLSLPRGVSQDRSLSRDSGDLTCSKSKGPCAFGGSTTGPIRCKSR